MALACTHSCRLGACVWGVGGWGGLHVILCIAHHCNSAFRATPGVPPRAPNVVPRPKFSPVPLGRPIAPRAPPHTMHPSSQCAVGLAVECMCKGLAMIPRGIRTPCGVAQKLPPRVLQLISSLFTQFKSVFFFTLRGCTGMGGNESQRFVN